MNAKILEIFTSIESKDYERGLQLINKLQFDSYYYNFDDEYESQPRLLILIRLILKSFCLFKLSEFLKGIKCLQRMNKLLAQTKNQVLGTIDFILIAAIQLFYGFSLLLFGEDENGLQILQGLVVLIQKKFGEEEWRYTCARSIEFLCRTTLSSIFESQGKLSMAQSVIRSSFKNQTGLYLNLLKLELSKLLQRNNKPEEATEILEASLRQQLSIQSDRESEKKILLKMHELYIEQGNLEKAFHICDFLLNNCQLERKMVSSLYQYQAEYYLKQNKVKQGIESSLCSLQAIRHISDQSVAVKEVKLLIKLAEIHFDEGDLTNAYNVYQRALGYSMSRLSHDNDYSLSIILNSIHILLAQLKTQQEKSIFDRMKGLQLLFNQKMNTKPLEQQILLLEELTKIFAKGGFKEQIIETKQSIVDKAVSSSQDPQNRNCLKIALRAVERIKDYHRQNKNHESHKKAKNDKFRIQQILKKLIIQKSNVTSHHSIFNINSKNHPSRSNTVNLSDRISTNRIQEIKKVAILK